MRFRLKELREARHMTQADLANSIGRTLRVISAWEREETQITLESAAIIADVFDCTLDELAGREFPLPSYSDANQARLNALYGESDAEAQADILKAAENAHAASLGRTEIPGEEGAPPAGALSA